MGTIISQLLDSDRSPDLYFYSDLIFFYITVPVSGDKTAPPFAAAKPDVPSKGGKKSGNAGASGAGDLPVDVSRIDMRVGKIVEVERHPDADSLYVEKVCLNPPLLVFFVKVVVVSNCGLFICLVLWYC